jgi:uncharacterized protein (TIGR03000 family)
MYGMVLMAALTTAPDTTSFGNGYGCTGCTGTYAASCFGSSCYGSSCGGSCNGSIFPLFPRLRAAIAGRFGCHSSSCYGSSCYGSSCYGSSCYGSSCYGSSCYGSVIAGHTPTVAVASSYPSSCHGFGSGCVGVSYPSASCFGSTTLSSYSGIVSSGAIVQPTASFGYSSGPVYYGADFHPSSSSYCEPTMGTVLQPSTFGAIVPQVRIDRSEHQVTKAKPEAGPARLTIELPADAKLYVDGVLTTGEGSTRNFHTPDLPNGQSFYYDLKAVLMIDGKTVTDTKTVIVKSGDALSEEFPKLIAAANANKKDSLVKR